MKEPPNDKRVPKKTLSKAVAFMVFVVHFVFPDFGYV